MKIIKWGIDYINFDNLTSFRIKRDYGQKEERYYVRYYFPGFYLTSEPAYKSRYEAAEDVKKFLGYDFHNKEKR